MLLRLTVVFLLLASPALADEPNNEIVGGNLALADDGRPLNLDFETGTLDDWTAEGDAFTGQPVKGDTVHARRDDMHSAHTGDHWIGSYEVKGDGPHGTLTSAAFEVSHPYATFLVAGGPYETTRVELIDQANQEVIFHAEGTESEDLAPVLVDLREHQGKRIAIRLVDRHDGHWGHINFDDFLFHAAKPQLPNLIRTYEQIYEHAGLSPEQAAEAMTVPEGFSVKLFAGEPDVIQPIAMALDDRGRLWVAEAYSYPKRLPDEEAHDRILIFEDENGDGRFDRRTVFADKLNLVSGLELGFGGVWVGAAPHLLFIPDRDRNDVPDGEPEVLLDGWGYEDTHETLNSFIWGPDGWLYGCHGIFTHSKVGKPGTPDDQRVYLNAGIWRYHPTKHEFEVFAHGTSNPWGVDFNDRGQCFLACCVIPHLFHVAQGGRYLRQAGDHFNPHTYADIDTIAKHRHWVGNQWRDADRAKSDSVGGGHAHAGAMVYLGGVWPDEYRDRLFMNNIHGARINQDVLTPKGSGYTGDGAPDFIATNDRWSQIVYLTYGPDGQVYMIDWYDKNQCHRNETEVHDRSNGRIFKVVYGEPETVQVDLATATDEELVRHQFNDNDWYVRHARRVLQERGPNPKVHKLLEEIAFDGAADETRRLRALWALHVTGGLTDELVARALADRSSPYVRGWAIQLAMEDRPHDDQTLDMLTRAAANDESPIVRMYLASAADRLPAASRWKLVEALVSHSEDAQDHNLPLMYWYAGEPLAGLDHQRAIYLAKTAKTPNLLDFMFRRVASGGEPEALAFLVHFVNMLGLEPDNQRLTLNAMELALRGKRRVEMPAEWSGLAAALEARGDAELNAVITRLSVRFGDPAAMAKVRTVVKDTSADLDERRYALASLLNVKDDDLAPTLHDLIAEGPLLGEALRGLASYDVPETSKVILAAYGSLDADRRRDALNTLASRLPYAQALLAAVKAGEIDPKDLSADLVRQLRNLKDEDLDALIVEVWGIVRDTPEDRAQLIAHYRDVLGTRTAASGDLALGRAMFVKTCQQCHTLFGVGNKIGPELTGSDRANLDYLLSNVLDPSAVMAKQYMPSVIETTDGRIVTGLVRPQADGSLLIHTANESFTLPKDEILTDQLADTSMMPDDLLKPLADDEVRALVSYLAAPVQSPMLATPDTVKHFFNGEDLAGWEGKLDLWTVENGELVGRTNGLDHNEFLKSSLTVGDFRLSVDVKLSPNTENSGIQFRSETQSDGHVKGYQADIGTGWWGKLYEELGRGLLWDQTSDQHVRPGEWNSYEIVAEGSRIRTWLNGEPCVDLDDPEGAKRGIIALQLHSGGAMEIRFRNMRLEAR